MSPPEPLDLAIYAHTEDSGSSAPPSPARSTSPVVVSRPPTPSPTPQREQSKSVTERRTPFSQKENEDTSPMSTASSDLFIGPRPTFSPTPQREPPRSSAERRTPLTHRENVDTSPASEASSSLFVNSDRDFSSTPQPEQPRPFADRETSFSQQEDVDAAAGDDKSDVDEQQMVQEDTTPYNNDSAVVGEENERLGNASEEQVVQAPSDGPSGDEEAKNQTTNGLAVASNNAVAPAEELANSTSAERGRSVDQEQSMIERMLQLEQATNANGQSTNALGDTSTEQGTSTQPNDDGETEEGLNDGSVNPVNNPPPSPEVEAFRPPGGRGRAWPQGNGRRPARNMRSPTPFFKREFSPGLFDNYNQEDRTASIRQPAPAMPCASDFGPHSRSSLNREEFVLGPKRRRMRPDDPSLPAFAPAPKIPKFTPSTSGTPPRRPRHRIVPPEEILSERSVSPEADAASVRSQEQSRKRPRDDNPSTGPYLGSLGSIPPENRRTILEQILVSKEPIHVFEGWTKPRSSNRSYKRPDIDISVLLVCKQLYWECLPVLYGANKFLYLLRDAVPTAPPPVHVDGLPSEESSAEDVATVATELDDDDDEAHGDGEYVEEERSARPSRRSTRGGRQKRTEGGLLNIAKFISLIRDVTIVAEQNRYGVDTMKSMADAIQVFVKPPTEEIEKNSVPIDPSALVPNEPARKRTLNRNNGQSQTKQNKPNLRSLNIRIHPMTHGWDEVEEAETFTFTGFFAAQSIVTKALLHLQVQFLHIDLIPTKLTDSRSVKPVRMALDLRPRRIQAGIKYGEVDFWAGDRAIRAHTLYRRRLCYKKLRSLQVELVKCCRSLRKHGLTAEELGLWDEISDIDWDFDDEEMLD